MQRQAQLVRPQVKSTQKAKEVEAVKQGIKQEESLEMIQTLLGASVRISLFHNLSTSQLLMPCVVWMPFIPTVRIISGPLP